MSRYSGPAGRGAARQAREQRRVEAEARSARTLQERTAWFRRQRVRIRAALAKLDEPSSSAHSRLVDDGQAS